MQSNFHEKPLPLNEQPANQSEETGWFVYILRCADDTLYTGITTNLARRLKEHNSPAGGARYTRSRRPVSMIYAENVINRSAACSREYQLKRFSRTAKEELIIISAGLLPSSPITL